LVRILCSFNVVTNDDLTKLIDDSEFRKGRIEERRHIMRRYNHLWGVKAAKIAIERSGVAKRY
jgi:hypothetical protein